MINPTSSAARGSRRRGRIAEAGSAVVPWLLCIDAETALNASAIAPALWYRSAMVLVIARSTIASSSGGISGLKELGAAGVFCSTCTAVSLSFLPWNALRPVNISNRIAPRVNRSDRWSTPWPSTSSGDMYAVAPRPSAVPREARRAAVSLSLVSSCHAESPRSRIFVCPLGVTMMLWGVSSLWTSPAA